MVYKLDKDDQRCDVTYIDWSKKYSPIPKATCDMIQPKCSSGGGGSDNTPELSCEDIKKLLKGEDKPKEDKPKEDKPKEDEKPREETPSDNVGGKPAEDKEKPTTEEVTPKEPEPNPSPREEDTPRTEETPTQPTPEPPVADTPREETPNEEGKEVNLLELMPKVEENLSSITYENGVVREMSEESTEEKRAFEMGIITTLKGKLPERAVVEAVLGEPYYKVGSEHVKGKTNYTISVRVTLDGKVYEQEYNVPTKEIFRVGHVDNI